MDKVYQLSTCFHINNFRTLVSSKQPRALLTGALLLMVLFSFGQVAPTVVTVSVSQFTASSAVAGGNVTSDGGATVTERGVVYNTTGNPGDTDNKFVFSSGGTGSYSRTITGLSSNTTYYVKAYAINSVDTTYGPEVTFTTAANFVLPQIHYFNSAWVSTTNRTSPYTKYVEGWHITATSTGTGLVSINRITGTTGTTAVAEGAASARAISTTTTEELVSMKIMASDSSAFDLQSFQFKYLTKDPGTSFGTITVTGYLNGVAVPGAVESLTGIGEATSSSYAYSTFDFTGNNNFNNIDEFIITASDPADGARLSAIDIDVLDVQLPVVLPLTLTNFSGKLAKDHAVLNWNTEQEENTSSFDIEHSTDGIQFVSVGNVKAAGNSQLNRAYTFTHEKLATGNNYYRLKMNDADGKFTYSPIVKIEWTGGKQGFSVYPNPVTGNHFFITIAAGTTLPLSFRIIDGYGKSVQRYSLRRTQFPQTSGLSGDRAVDSGAGHRGDDCDVHCRELDPAAAAAISGTRTHRFAREHKPGDGGRR